jgi:hypothetical protein
MTAVILSAWGGSGDSDEGTIGRMPAQTEEREHPVAREFRVTTPGRDNDRGRT